LIDLLTKHFADQSLNEKVLKKTDSQSTLAAVLEEEEETVEVVPVIDSDCEHVTKEADDEAAVNKIQEADDEAAVNKIQEADDEAAVNKIQEADDEAAVNKIQEESARETHEIDTVPSTTTESESKTSKLPLPLREDDSDFKFKRENDPDAFEASKKQRRNPIQTHSKKEKPGFHLKKFKATLVTTDIIVPQPSILLPRDDPVTEFTFEGPQDCKI
jgi:hypothetical protein